MVYISRLERSKSTALCFYGKAALKQTELLDEVPLRSSFDTELRLPLWFWNLTGRIQWFLNHPRQAESRRLTERRARKLVGKVCAAGEDCILVTHGFYMHTLVKEFQKAGFKTKQRRAYYQNGQEIALCLPTPREGTSMSSEISKQNEKLTEFLKLFQHKLRCILGAKLISIYIHGSVAQNAFR